MLCRAYWSWCKQWSVLMDLFLPVFLFTAIFSAAQLWWNTVLILLLVASPSAFTSLPVCHPQWNHDLVSSNGMRTVICVKKHQPLIQVEKRFSLSVDSLLYQNKLFYQENSWISKGRLMQSVDRLCRSRWSESLCLATDNNQHWQILFMNLQIEWWQPVSHCLCLYSGATFFERDGFC